MLDDRLYARRTTPLSHAAAATSALPGGVRVRPLPPAARFSLRTRQVAGLPAEVAGFRLDQAINRVSGNGERWSARLGPDEWLLGAPEADADQLAGEIGAALASRPHALVAVSHRNVAIEVSGRGAADALNAGCPLDLSDAAFPAGTATRTLLGKCEIVLIRAGSGPTYQVEVWRSFATYAHGFLVEAAHGLGSDGLGANAA